MRGNLRHSSLADVLRHLYAERESGVLHLTREGIQRRVHFRKGVAIFAEAADSPPLSRDQAESLFYSLFTWISGEFSFERLEPNVDESCAFTSSPSVLILEGSRRIAERRILEDLIGGPDSLFSCAQTSVLPLFTMKLSPPESAILKFARERERFTARDLPLPPSTLDVVRALNSLVSVGLLEVVKKAPVSEPSPPIPAPPRRDEVENMVDTFRTKRDAAPAPPGVESAARPKPVPRAPVEMQRKPARRGIAIAAASLAIVAIAVLLGLSLWSRRRESARSDSVAAADSAPTDPEPVATAPPPVNPEGQLEEDSEPSDAELFYSANLAFESGDYERSKTELEALLERQPGFAAARELMTRVQRELTPKPRVAEETRASRKVVETPKAAPEPARVPATAAHRDPAELFEAARSAFARSDLETAQSRLDALEAVQPSYPGASALQDELALRFWERTLPLAFNVRHDHALGSCTGVLHLTRGGFSYRSKEHEWAWSFAEVTETERRAPSRLRIETTRHTSYNFELRERPSDEDWARHEELRHR